MYRARHDSPPLVWDDVLANESTEYAKELRFCLLHHSDNAYKTYGETLYCTGGFPKPPNTCTVAIHLFYSEVLNYKFSTKTQFQDNKNNNIGHFTQLVWKNTKRMGCGAMYEDNWPLKALPGINGAYIVVVCRFLPSGNIPTDEAFKGNVLPYNGKAN
jgi:hypothetical protein